MMKLFVWSNVERVTGSYHDGGGVAAIAETLERARELLVKQAPECEALTADPDLVRDCDGPEYLEIFPDAGCC
jgi:hypothetical protein